MFEILIQWYRRYFNNPETIALLAILMISFGVLFLFSNFLTPLLIAIILAYLLECPTTRLEKIGCSRNWAISIVLVLFVSILLLISFVVMPIVWQQGIYLMHDIPSMLSKLSNVITALSSRYPTLTDAGIIDAISENIRFRVMTIGDSVVKYSLTSLIRLFRLVIYLILVPIMIFFLIKDKEQILNVTQHILPCNSRLAEKIWKETNHQIINYIRGKALEMILVSTASWFGFVFFRLNYSLLLAVLVGFSVLIPYIGNFIAMVPVVGVSLSQFGLSTEFWSCFITYLIIQGIDGNLLVPVLFSEAVNLHPLIIILSVVMFGRLFGFWGIFFAIPLAILIKVIIYLLFTERNMHN